MEPITIASAETLPLPVGLKRQYPFYSRKAAIVIGSNNGIKNNKLRAADDADHVAAALASFWAGDENEGCPSFIDLYSSNSSGMTLSFGTKSRPRGSRNLTPPQNKIFPMQTPARGPHWLISPPVWIESCIGIPKGTSTPTRIRCS